MTKADFDGEAFSEFEFLISQTTQVHVHMVRMLWRVAGRQRTDDRQFPRNHRPSLHRGGCRGDAHHIQRGLGAFDVEPLHGDDIKRRRKNMLKRRLPHLAAEKAGVVVGYAYAVPFRKRPAYRYAVKHSIYVHPDHLHSGVGRRLLPALIDACTAAGFRQIVAYIDAANEPSQRLHEAFGFDRAGLLKGVGFKYGRWTDSILMQRALEPGDTAPLGNFDGTPIPQGGL